MSSRWRRARARRPRRRSWPTSGPWRPPCSRSRRGGGDERADPPAQRVICRSVWALIVFTLVFVALGITVLFVAMSGGPGGARRRMASQSRGTRRLALVNFLIALLVLGLGIPAAVIATVDNRNDIPEANVSDLTKAEENGRQLFGERCANCHTLKAASAVAQVGPNLDNLRPPENLVLNAIENGRARGNGNMAADLVEGEDAKDVASFVAKAVGQSEEKQATSK